MFDYDAFISYRRGDGAWHARTLRQRLQEVRVPPEITAAHSDRKLRIYLDQIYERATDDFFEDTIKPALAASRHLIVVKTRSAMTALPDGRQNWLEREVEYFCSLAPEGRSISVAIASGDLTGPLPARLDETHPNIERLDLRHWRGYRAPAVDDQLLSLAATLHEIRPSDMPALRQEDVRRHAALKRRRLLVAGVVTGLVLGSSAVAGWQYLRVRDESYRRSIAVAASVWNRLNFSDTSGNKLLAEDDLNALWEVRLATQEAREAFITELVSGGDRAIRFGRRPAAVMRAIHFQWPENEAAAVFDAAVRQTTSKEFADEDDLWQTSETVARALPTPRVGPAVATVLAATKGKMASVALPTLRVLAGKVSAVEAQTFLAPIFKQIGTEAASDTLKEDWAVVATFGAMATPDQSDAVRAAAVRAFESASDQNELEMLARAVGALPGRLSSDQAGRVLSPIAKQIAETKWAFQTLGRAVASLAPALPPDEGPHALALVLSKFNAEDIFAADEFCAPIAALAPILDPDHAQATLDRISKASRGVDSALAAEPVLGAMSSLSERLTAEQAQVMLPSVLQTLEWMPIEVSQASLERAVNTIVGRLSPSQAERSLADTVASLGLPSTPAPPYAARALMVTVRALARLLSPDQRGALVQSVCERRQATINLEILMPLKSLTSVLGGSCTLNSDATPTLQRLLAAVDTANVSKSLEDAQRFEELSEMATADQARALLVPTLTALQHQEGGPGLVFAALALQSWSARGLLSREDEEKVRSVAVARIAAVRQPNAIPTFVSLLASLPLRLTGEQGQAVVTALLKANDASFSRIVFADHQVAEASLAIAPQLPSEQRRTLALAMESELAWAQTDEWALAAAKAAIALLPPEPETRAAAIIEMMKYPTAAGSAAGALLTALRETAATPPADGGEDLPFDWIRSSFPHANLEAPPACPSPRHQGLACPATTPAR